MINIFKNQLKDHLKKWGFYNIRAYAANIWFLKIVKLKGSLWYMINLSPFVDSLGKHLVTTFYTDLNSLLSDCKRRS